MVRKPWCLGERERCYHQKAPPLVATHITSEDRAIKGIACEEVLSWWVRQYGSGGSLNKLAPTI